MSGPRPAVGHMPFPGHRTQEEVLRDEQRYDQLPWCPPAYRDMYRQLRRNGWPASECRPMVERLIERERVCRG